MLSQEAEKNLKYYADTAYQKKMHQVNDRIRCFVGYGHSNCTVIEGDTSLILIDALESNARAERLKEALQALTPKPVKTIIYTHGHPDHRGGSGAFKDTVEEIIAFAPKRAVLKHMDKLSDVLGQRTVKQFGYALSDEELITQGLGIREGAAMNDGVYDILPPTTLYTEEMVERTIDGVPLKMVAAVGETDDQIFIWLPEDKALCCGDNYYGCWPNLYAIRGSQYRDIAAWVDSLEMILTYPAEALLPGHTNPIFGAAAIKEVLGSYKGAIESILLQTIDCMNRGLSESETIKAVKLPEQYQNKPYLGEYYGTIEWSIRSIYNGYFGWFDGNAVHLSPLPNDIFSSKLVSLIGTDQLLSEIDDAYAQGQYQMGLQLCELLLEAGLLTAEANARKHDGLLAIAKQMPSSNGRHYYIASAKELEK